MLNVKQSTGNVMLVGEVGMFLPSVRCHRNTRIYFIRLNDMPQGSLLKYVFLESKDCVNEAIGVGIPKYGNWHSRTIWI